MNAAREWISVLPWIKGLSRPYQITTRVASLRDASARAWSVCDRAPVGLKHLRACRHAVALGRALARRLRAGEVR